MKREIKFRAWDEVSEQMCEVAELYKVGGVRLDVYDEVRDRVYQVDRADPPIMQYTGVKDKNGKEIYEGDIFDMGVVIFSRGCFNGCYISGSTNERGWDFSDDWEDGLEVYARENEIKGNIYENPELVERDQ